LKRSPEDEQMPFKAPLKSKAASSSDRAAQTNALLPRPFEAAASAAPPRHAHEAHGADGASEPESHSGHNFGRMEVGAGRLHQRAGGRALPARLRTKMEAAFVAPAASAAAPVQLQRKGDQRGRQPASARGQKHQLRFNQKMRAAQGKQTKRQRRAQRPAQQWRPAPDNTPPPRTPVAPNVAAQPQQQPQQQQQQVVLPTPTPTLAPTPTPTPVASTLRASAPSFVFNGLRASAPSFVPTTTTTSTASASNSNSASSSTPTPVSESKAEKEDSDKTTSKTTGKSGKGRFKGTKVDLSQHYLTHRQRIEQNISTFHQKAPSYTSSFDKNGGYSNEYEFTHGAVVHVHRHANGNPKFAQVKPSHLKGSVHAGESIPLHQLATYGIPHNDSY
jgi:hypothetical protein